MTPDIDELLEEIRCELLRIRVAKEIGTVTVHIGPGQYILETNTKKPAIKYKAPESIPAKS